MQIRLACLEDMPDIQAIYAHHVLTGTGTFDEAPPSLEQMIAKFETARQHGWVWLVAADETGVLGYASYAQLRPRTAYRYAAENSMYVREDVRGQGVGKALGTALLEAAEAQGFRQMVAVIGDAENVGSIGVHASLGFQKAGMLRGVGYKFGRWLDAVYMQKTLGRGTDSTPD